jgi:hypothetical protein
MCWATVLYRDPSTSLVEARATVKGLLDGCDVKEPVVNGTWACEERKREAARRSVGKGAVHKGKHVRLSSQAGI